MNAPHAHSGSATRWKFAFAVSMCLTLLLLWHYAWLWHFTPPSSPPQECDPCGECACEPCPPAAAAVQTWTEVKFDKVERLSVSSTVPQFVLHLHPSPDYISDHFAKHGSWKDCLDTLAIIDRYFKGKQLVIAEVGGNIGACALLYASLPQGHLVYSFEPNPQNYELFMKSLADNPNLPGEVLLVQAGASERKETQTIHVDLKNYGNSIVAADRSKIEGNKNIGNFHEKFDTFPIKLTRLDDVVRQHVNLLKMDCQGSELSAMLGATQLFAKHGVDVIYFEYVPSMIRARDQNPVELLKLVQLLGFTIYLDKQMVKDVEKFTEAIPPNIVQLDLIAFHKTFQV